MTKDEAVVEAKLSKAEFTTGDYEPAARRLAPLREWAAETGGTVAQLHDGSVVLTSADGSVAELSA